MKGLGILLMVALLAFAPDYASAQQSEKQGQLPPKEKVEEFKFPENPKVEEFKFPESQPTEKVKSPMDATQPQGQKEQEEPAQPLKNYSAKEKKAYLKKTAAALAEIQKRIDSFKVKQEYKTLQRRNANRMIMVDLQKKSLNARKQLAALEEAPDMIWSGEKAKLELTILNVQKAFSDALRYFEEADNSPKGRRG
jgi:hypothetical protein